MNNLKLLIQEMVRNVLLQEAKFNPRAYSNTQELLTAARTKLRLLGEGSSRIVYVLDSKRALKIAYNEKGYGQNQAELDLSSNPHAADIHAKIFDYDPEYKWLISELVRPLDKADFRSIMGFEWAFVGGVINAARYPWDDMVSMLKDRWRHLSIKYPQYKDGDAVFDSPWIRKVYDMARNHDLISGDLIAIGHWGKTPDNRVVLLDYGYTEEVYQQHYLQ